MWHLPCRWFSLACLSCSSLVVAVPQEHEQEPEQDAVVQRLMDFELEELARLPVTVTSVSKSPEQRSQAASAVFVISSEDLRRGAVTSVPEALRMVPGLHVAQLDANKWAITGRGFGGEFANKLLVLIDGRSVYTPLFAGVYWDVQDLLIEDIDRIEVIRGPGATVWGANAVNGVINIITRRADQTPGALIKAHLGDEERIVGGRYGFPVGADGHVRAWAKSRDVDGFETATGADAGDDWDLDRIGFRFDRGRPDVAAGWTVTGELYEGDLNETNFIPSLTPPFGTPDRQTLEVAGGHLLARWDRALDNGSRATVQAYLDHTERERPAVLSEDRRTLDVEFDYRIQIDTGRDLTWGLGYRYTEDRIEDSQHIQLRGDRRRDDLFSAFLQHGWRTPRGHLTVGSKFSHNDYSGFEIQPSIRGSWSVNDKTVLWASLSRAVRTPSRGEHDALLDLAVLPPPQPGLPLTLIQLTGTEEFDAEDLTALEFGYRAELTRRMSLDLALFYNDYAELIGLRSGEPFLQQDPFPVLVVPLLFANNSEATTRGLEASLDLVASPGWRLQAGYAYLDFDLDGESEPGEVSSGLPSFEEQSPQHQGFLRSHLNLAPDWELDANLYYVDDLPAFAIGGHLRLDLRVGWRPRDGLLLSMGGKNLLDDRHIEFGRSLFSLPSHMERSFFVQAVYELD